MELYSKGESPEFSTMDTSAVLGKEQRVNTVNNKNVNVARPKAVPNAVKGNQIKSVMAWGPKRTEFLTFMCHDNPQQDFDGDMLPSGGNPKEENHRDHLGKFDGKADRNSLLGSGPNWLFDIDALTKLMNYKPVVAENQSNGNVGTKACDDPSKSSMETVNLGKITFCNH
ncbi:hypothetical protein Tco_1402511 [Tanacetum coccineum]